MSPPLNHERWRQTIDAELGGHYLRAAIGRGWLNGQRAVLIHDLDMMGEKIRELQAAFPPHTLHALAIKANPLVKILKAAVSLHCGLECASIEEVALAHAAQCPASSIVFDSPAKTETEIEHALAMGITLNADNFSELERIQALYEKSNTYQSRVGLRINPQTGAGRIGATSVAGTYSKFGIPLGARQNEILEAFARHPFLTGLHVHIGSQGTSLDPMVEAVRRAFDLRQRIEAHIPGRKIAYIDIGGGLPWRYVDDDQIQPTPGEYWAALAERVPETTTGEVQLMTEFGRSIQAGCGVAASKIEYVKTETGINTAVIHLGADLLLRRVYNPSDWRHRFSVLTADGHPKTGPVNPYNIAGPLCFGGDFVARDALLPEIRPGDWLMIHDVGAYTLSMWSRHCSRSIPRVLGMHKTLGASGLECSLLREAESVEDICRYWS